MGESRSTDAQRVGEDRARGGPGSSAIAPPSSTASDPFLSALLDAADDALWAESTHGTVVAWSAGAERLFGWPAADIVGRPADRLLPSDARPFSVPQRGESLRSDRTLRRRDGTMVPVSVAASPIIDPDGNRIGTSRSARRRSTPPAGTDLMVQLDRALADALEADAVLDALTHALVPAIADACITYAPRRNGSIRRVTALHVDTAGQQALLRLLELPEPEIEDAAGPGVVLRTGVPVLVSELPREKLDTLPPPQRAALRALDPSNVAMLPLRARGRTVGVVALLVARTSGRTLTRTSLAPAFNLVDRAALALDNARLFAEAQAELARRHLAEDALRQRFEHLGVVYHMTEAVARSAALESIYDEALDGLRRGIRVDRAAILLADGAGVMKFRAWRGISDAYRGAVEGHNPWAGSDTNPQPIVISDIDSAPGVPHPLLDDVRAEGIRAMAFIPLVFQQRLLGKFMLYFDAPRVLTNEELALAQTIASTIAFAITRVRAEQSVRIARDMAEDANQAKSQFLGVMSHELRTPLNAVLGYADLLLMEVRGPLSSGQREQIERIRASARHQLQLIEELLTFTRLQAGRDQPHLAPAELRRVVTDVAEFVRPEAERKGLALRLDLPDRPLHLVTDPARLRQIVLNLAANATKFTESGEVVLGAARITDGFVVRVRDTGPGIPRDKIDYIFEPFAQASEGRTRATGGTGLGLAIARRFADLIGATIDVRTRPGEGATFLLRLPSAPPVAMPPAPRPVDTRQFVQ